jgi:hypothetical protein
MMNKLLHTSKGEKNEHGRKWLWRQMLFLLVLLTTFSSIELKAQTITIDGSTTDWNFANFSLNPVRVYKPDPHGNGVVDDQFTGSKDFFFASALKWEIGQTKGKNDIANAAAVISNGILYFAGDRSTNEGDAQIGFWLYLNGTGPRTLYTSPKVGGDFYPEHQIGDLFILSDFTGGGRTGTVSVYRWVGSGGNVVGSEGTLNTTGITGNVAENNKDIDNDISTVPTGWLLKDKNGNPTPEYEQNQFFEGQVVLDGPEFDLDDIDLCNASILLETRSSQSITASLDDFVGASFNITPTVTVNSPTVCANALPVTITATPGDGTPNQFDYTWTVPPAYVGNPGNVQSFPTSVAGTYTVVIRRKGLDCPSAPASGTIIINPVTTATDFDNAVRCVGGASVTFTTTAGGTGPFTYQWSKGGAPIAGATNNSYTIAGPITAAQAGTYSVTVSGACGTASQDATLTVNPVTTATDPSDAARCVGGASVTFTTTAGGTGPFTYQWSKDGAPIAGATNNSYTVTGPITAVQGGTYSVTISGTCGTASQSAVLTVNPLPIISCSATPTQIDIMSAAHNSQLNVDLSANADTDPTHYSYLWTEDGAGSFNFNNVKNPVYTAGILDAAQTVSFTVTVTNLLTGCISTSNCSLTVNTIGSCPGVPTAEICNGSTNEYTADRAPSVNESWKWSVNNGASIDGADNAQTVKVIAGGQSFTLTLTITYANTDISPSVCPYEVAVVACGGYCTYTQGKYGNTSPACDGDGIGDGVAITYPTVVDMIKAMLGVGGVTNPLVIGSNGKFVTIPATASAAVLLNASMPGGGTASELIGSVTVDNVPSLPSLWTPAVTKTSVTYITKQGRINNVFLSQTIALGLNMRVSGGLGNFALEAGTFATAKAVGGCGSTIPTQRSCYYNELGQLVVVNEYTYRSIGQDIINALNCKGYALTVSGLYQLANDALGNADGIIDTECGAKISNISGAVAAFNEGFDECRIFIGWNVGPCEVPSRRININSSGVINSADLTAQTVESLRVSAYPNPFAEKVSFAIVSPVSGKASLEIYNMFGQKLQTVYEGYLTAGRTQLVEFRPGSTSTAGTLIYKLNVAGKQVTGKLVNLKQ